MNRFIVGYLQGLAFAILISLFLLGMLLLSVLSWVFFPFKWAVLTKNIQ